MTAVFETKPDAFECQVATAGVFVWAEDRLLYLQNGKKRYEGFEWAIPGGKQEKGETIERCARRELLEETAIDIQPVHLDTLYIVKPYFSFTFHIFESHLETIEPVALSEEHNAYAWCTPEEALELPLVSGGKEVLEWYLNFSKS